MLRGFGMMVFSSSTWWSQVSAIASTLRSSPHYLPTVVLSIDDLYLPHSVQLLLASSNPLNALVQHRGEPGTHDIALGLSLFRALKAHQHAKIPAYDKSAFNGQGDRADESTWEEVNVPGSIIKVQIVIFEGWCVGFRALGSEELRRKWEDARESKEGALWKHPLEDLEFINNKLRDYDTLTEYASIRH
jgi:D-glycerate 3-kinase